MTRLAKLLLLVAVLAVGVGPAAAHRPRPLRAFPQERPFSADFVVALQPKHGSINKLLASLTVKPKYRFESRALRGFAANLTFRQTQRLLQDPDVDCVCSDDWSWIVLYDNTRIAYPDMAARTGELVAKYGFTTRVRYSDGFAAQLSAAQLHGLTTEADIGFIEPDRYVSWAGFRPHDVPGTPHATWKVLSYGSSRQSPTSNHIYYARRADQTRRWTSRLSAADRRAVEHVNYSRYGMLAIFSVPRPKPFRVSAVLLVKDGLSAGIQPPPWGCPLAIPCPPPKPTREYALILIRKDSLPSPVKLLYIREDGIFDDG